MSYSELPFVMIKCLGCTIVIEFVVALILGIRNNKDILNIVLVNIITNPIVVSLPFLIFMNFGYLYYRICFYSLEVLTVLLEGFIYYKVLDFKKINPFLLSLVLNICSYGIGELINYFM